MTLENRISGQSASTLRSLIDAMSLCVLPKFFYKTFLWGIFGMKGSEKSEKEVTQIPPPKTDASTENDFTAFSSLCRKAITQT